MQSAISVSSVSSNFFLAISSVLKILQSVFQWFNPHLSPGDNHLFCKQLMYPLLLPCFCHSKIVSLALSRYLELSVACQVPYSKVKETSDTVLTMGGCFDCFCIFVSVAIGRF